MSRSKVFRTGGVFSVLALLTLPAFGQVTFSPILFTSQTVPALGSSINSFTAYPRINANGGVAVSVSSGATRAILQGTGGSWRLVAKNTQNAPGVSGKVIAWLNPEPLILADQGYVLFTGIDGPDIDHQEKDCLWAEDSVGVNLIARQDQLTQQSSDIKWSTGVASRLGKVFSNDGEVGLVASCYPLATPGVNLSTVWMGTPTTFQIYGRQRGAPPGINNSFDGQGNPNNGWRLFDDLALGTSGEATFYGQVQANAGGVYLSEGVWKRVSVQVDLLYLNAQPITIPAGGVPFAIQLCDGAGNGDALILESFSGGNTALLWHKNNGSLNYAVGGGPVTGLPDTTVGVTQDYSVISSSGRIAAVVTAASANQTRTNGQTVINLDGYAVVAGRNGNFSAIAVNNQQAPGLPAGVNFKLNSDDSVFATDDFKPALTPQGRLMFMTKLQGAGVVTTNNKALWLSQPDSGATLALRTGQTISVLGTNRVVTDFFVTTGSGGDDGRPRGHNDAGQVALWITFATGPSIIAVASAGPTVPVVEGGGSLPAIATTRGPGANEITLNWSTALSGVQLESTTNMPATAWTTVAGATVQNGTNYSQVFTNSGRLRLFRLHKP